MRLPVLLALPTLVLACAGPAATAPAAPPEARDRRAPALIDDEDPARPRIYELPALPPPHGLPEDPPPPRNGDDEAAAPDPQPLVIATPADPPAHPPFTEEHVPGDPRPGEETPIAKPDGRPDAQPAQPPPKVPDPVGPERLLYCERRSDRCWACATLDLTVELPCEKHVCTTGICVVSEPTGKARCAPAERRCCERGDCARAPTRTACAPSCGDPSGDGIPDRCLLPDVCAEQTLFQTDVIRSYGIARPPSWYRALCGPLPEAVRGAGEAQRPRAPLQLAREPQEQQTPPARCDGTPVLWTIPAEVMGTGASDRGGPGICYGVGIDPGLGRLHTCGQPHCDTLRYCDGRERQMYCTVVSTCVNGVRRASGFTW